MILTVLATILVLLLSAVALKLLGAAAAETDIERNPNIEQVRKVVATWIPLVVLLSTLALILSVVALLLHG